jgi:hypothetical protein
MVSFLSLPDVLCVEVMFKWCDVKGICNSEHRPVFLKNFCGNSLNVSTGMNDHLMKWINSRSVKPTSFVVYKSCVFASWKDAIDWSEILDVTFLGRDKRPFQTTNLIEIVNKCEKLISIKLTKSKFFYGRVFSSFSDELLARLTHISLDYQDQTGVDLFVDALLIHLTEKCHGLRSLGIHICNDDDATESVVVDLIKSNPHLEKVDIRFVENETEMFSNDFLPNLVASYPNLTSLNLDQVCEMNLNFITKTLADDFTIGRFTKFGMSGPNDRNGKERFDFTSNSGVRSVVFDDITGEKTVTDEEMVEFFYSCC